MTSGGSTGPGDRGGVAGGSVVGPYRLVELLGRGGMGEVWRAEDPTGAAGGAPRPVALKLIDPGLAADPAVRARFAREVAALRKVASPYVAPLLDADVDPDPGAGPGGPGPGSGPAGLGVPWLASAYVAGPTLADHVARHGPLSGPPLRALGAALAEALVAIHAAGVVHRDLTPRNVVLGPDGPRVVDFGIAWFPGAVPVTQAGSAVGTPSWMAPERLAAGEATAASDVWSWGALMVYAAGGRTELPAWLAPWVQAATATDPGARPSATELRAALADAATRPEGAELATTLGLDPTWQMDEPPAATRVLGTDPGGGGPPPLDEPDRRRLRSWGSAAGVLAAAAVVGVVAGLLASVLVAAVLVLVTLVLQHRRAGLSDEARPVPPTWAVAFAGPVVVSAGLVHAFGPVAGAAALVALLVLFVVTAGDAVF